jgi:hypothetical protein
MTLNHPPQSAAVKRVSHFKANPAILKRKGVLEILKAAWQDHPSSNLNPRVKFSLACDRLCDRYKELQATTKDLDEVFGLLKADVRRLKSELEEGNDPDDIQELLLKNCTTEADGGEQGVALEKALANQVAWRR